MKNLSKLPQPEALPSSMFFSVYYIKFPIASDVSFIMEAIWVLGERWLKVTFYKHSVGSKKNELLRLLDLFKIEYIEEYESDVKSSILTKLKSFQIAK